MSPLPNRVTPGAVARRGYDVVKAWFLRDGRRVLQLLGPDGEEAMRFDARYGKRDA